MSGAVGVGTVTGVIGSDRLGLTLPHEHLVNDLRSAVVPPTRPERAFLTDAAVTPELAWLLREDPYACRDHCVLDDVDAVVADLAVFAEAGGRSVIDLTPPGIGRDPAALRGIAERTGLNVIMGSGWYLQRFHPAHLARTGVDDLAAELVAEFRAEGPGAAGPGVIGEIGVSPDFTADEHTALRAACAAQREVGVPLFVHLPGWRRRAFEVLDIVLEEQGVDPGAVVLCHMDPSGEDPVYQLAVAERGAWLEFDMVGMPFRYPGEGQSPAPADTARAVRTLVRAGHAGRLLLSHDVFLKSMLTRHGGNGFGYVPVLFADRLRGLGVDDATVDLLLAGNPRRLFEAAARGRGARPAADPTTNNATIARKEPS
ncbi:phosphotriesterase-related protein [Spinactinospora alkalitolerans]|uniref:Phosphotriesterase-related protein n=1 Tax=Spinactinospora alkalitolerans TaxID=687207 RepID=A0A852TR77_9ACTN|nr:phosphotriesterase [Spinactinospora alkalitolerans]NYE46065.1 phosphotriesterase-related protein [Spinactinospora alkalitolerans]